MSSWGKLLQPNLWLPDTIFSLTPELLQHNGLKGLVMDVDETLVPFYESKLPQELGPWLDKVRIVIPQLWLASNNLSETRIKRIANTLNIPYIAGAGKPSCRKLRRAVEDMGLPPQKIGMVGDRLFTDVLAGNRLGMFTILVKPIIGSQDFQRRYSVHALEFKLSRALGASLVPYKS